MLKTLLPLSNEDPKPKRLTPQQIKDWNMFQSWLQENKYAGSEKLNERNIDLGRKLMLEYKKANPNFSLSYDDIRSVQYEMALLKEQAQAFAKRRGDASADSLMSGISKTDGWLGSKTSSWVFPNIRELDYHNGQLVSERNAGLVNGSFKPTGDSTQATPKPTIKKALPPGAFKDANGTWWKPDPNNPDELIRFNPY